MVSQIAEHDFIIFPRLIDISGQTKQLLIFFKILFQYHPAGQLQQQLHRNSFIAEFSGQTEGFLIHPPFDQYHRHADFIHSGIFPEIHLKQVF